ncbi:glycine betaine/L-proline ABC transporter substrate-binding protein ProX [Rhodohalobacter sp. 8-1]|uniref:glycine betaine/L-proline ABC transporter substrate-binding protein ProX n=1 Tax=Rhodohalobacter sp. 8-1 TaxID=3131972 RepID=UPI0030EDB675
MPLTYWKVIVESLAIILISGFLAGVHAQDQVNQEEELQVARATWDTGWFQAEVFRLLAGEMGYDVAPAQTMTAEEFYSAAASGEVDFWVNGWFPLHDPLISRRGLYNKIEPVGYEVEQGALQGYLVDAKSADSLGIESLAQLRDPEIAEHFDRDGNGKADLIGCNIDWSCHARINDHLEQLGLQETTEQIYGDYNPMAGNAIEGLKNGEPLLLYTWTPNWTLGEISPGSEVLWLHVPPAGGRQQINDLEGAARNPITLGYDLNDIRVVANRDFLREYPDLRALFEQLRISLQDIQQQNAAMAEGDGSLQDIREHARVWINNHKADLRSRLAMAGFEDPFGEMNGSGGSPFAGGDSSADGKRHIRVVTQQVEPLVVYQDRKYSGFSIDVFDAIAEEIGLEYSIYSVNSIAKMLDDVKRGEADVATAALGITSSREEMLEFSHSYYETGLQIMIPQKESSISTIPIAILGIIFSKEVMFIFIFFFGILLISAHIIWFSEKNNGGDFPNSYWNGLGVSIWWAAVTVTTVGYGDKTPKGIPGRIFGLIWIFAGYFAFSYFTATVTSTITLQEIESNIQNVEDLYGHKVATVSNSAADYYLTENGIRPSTYPTVREAAEALIDGKTDAIVYDAPVLQHFASGEGYGEVMVTGQLFQQQYYGFALPRGSELRKEINLGYLNLLENGEYQQIKNRWFGN